jgi:hypothetical protein
MEMEENTNSETSKMNLGDIDFQAKSGWNWLRPLELKIIQIIFRNSVRTSKRTHFTVTKITLLMLFKEIIVVSTEKHKKAINTECGVIDY